MNLRSLGRPLLAVTVAAACAGCSSYVVRRDTLSDASGEAVQANLAMQVTDPWPAAASRIDRTTSGERAQRAIERYRNNAQLAPGGPNAAVSGLAAGTPPPAGLPSATR